LDQVGLVTRSGLRALTLTTRKKSVTFTLPKVLNLSLEDTKQVNRGNIGAVADRLLEDLFLLKTDSRHYLTIDGLDDIYLSKPTQYEAVAALIVSAHRLNLQLRRRGLPIKILVMCRTDLFERVPGANTNKIRQDSAIQLDWYENTRHPESVRLVQLANLKARVREPSLTEIFQQYFPNPLRVGRRNNSTLRYLLDFSRHTPRDFLQLLKYIQQSAPESGRLSDDHVLNGIRNYSRDYFVPEIKNELSGPLATDEVALLWSLLGTCPIRRFTFEYVRSMANEPRFADFDLVRALSLLFDCSAIGHHQQNAQGKVYYGFKFRNRHASLDLSRQLIMHRAVGQALGIPF
jgi:hypothetical protein